jgi:long-chain acyl-CoA synthetase
MLKVKDVFLHPDPFTVDSGLLTPTFKMKRPEVVKTFSREIADMYAHLE